MQVEFYQDAANEWRWRARADNERIVATSAEGYANLSDCEHGLLLLTSLLRTPGANVVEIGSDGGRSIGKLAALMDKHGVQRRDPGIRGMGL